MHSLAIIDRGLETYEASFAAMRAYTDARTPDSEDQLWIVEHPPVFTLGLGADPSHVLDAHGIPVIQAGHFHRHRKAFLRAVDEPALQVFLWSKGDRVQHEIQLAPFLLDAREHRLELPFLAHVAGNDDGAAERFGQRAHVRLGLLVQVSDGEFRPGVTECLGASVGDAAVVRNADNQAFLVGEGHSSIAPCSAGNVPGYA